jgi:hypothetical protein
VSTWEESAGDFHWSQYARNREPSNPLENDGREGRHGQAKRPSFAVTFEFRGFDTTKVADIAATINRGIGIDGLTVEAWQRNPKAVRLARHRREIANNHCQRSVLLSMSAEDDDAIVTVVTDEPLESGGFTVELMERRQGPVDPVEITNQSPNAAVEWICE